MTERDEAKRGGAPSGDELITGTVLRASGALYEVDVPDSGDRPGAEAGDRKPLLCSLRGKLKQGRRATAQPVSVGDQVRVRTLLSAGPDARGRRLREGYVEELLPRRSELGRSRHHKTNQVAVANLDQVLIVMAVREPALNTHRLDRFLVLCEASDLHALICFNKCDLLSVAEMRAEVAPLMELYRGLGYTAVATSAETGRGIDAMRKLLKDHITAAIGSSGVGKSSLINAIQPGLHLWVGDVMEMGKGRHTTTDVSLHPLRGGGYLADTPGIKTVSLLEQEEVNLPQCFPEFLRYAGQCRFNNCSHVHEPGCRVHRAAEEREIAPERYASYLKMMEDAKPKKHQG